MKICHVTSVHQATDVRIFEKECCSLVKLGYDVDLIVADGHGSRVVNNVNIVDIGMPVQKRLNRFLFTRHYFYQKVLETDCLVYHLHDPELIPLGIQLLKKNKKVIFDSHEDIPKQILTKAWIPKVFRKLVSILYSIYERKQLKNFSALVAVNESICKRLQKINPSTYLISNYPIIQREWRMPNYDSEKICFAGNIKKEYCHHDILEVLREFPKVTYCLAGKVDDEYLKKLSSIDTWNQVKFEGHIPVHKVRSLYEESAIGIAIHEYTPNVGGKVGELSFVKIFEMMGAGLPIICTNFEVWKKIVDKEGCGICVEPHNLDEIRDAINYLTTHPNIAQKMGENGRRAVLREYNWETQMVVMSHLYRTII